MEELLDTIGSNEGAVAYLLLACSAALEYIFPPFPGDTVTLFGAFLVGARGWSLPAVFFVVTVGSVAGAALDYAIGVSLARERTEGGFLVRRWAKAQDRIDPVIKTLKKRGPAFLVINRFLPGVRAFFFVAAGMAGLRLRAVLFYAALSALLWNALIVAAGLALGSSWERLRAAGQMYTNVMWAAMGLAAAVLLARWTLRRWRSARAQQPEP